MDSLLLCCWARCVVDQGLKLPFVTLGSWFLSRKEFNQGREVQDKAALPIPLGDDCQRQDFQVRWWVCEEDRLWHQFDEACVDLAIYVVPYKFLFSGVSAETWGLM
jgi:hypothetical protein